MRGGWEPISVHDRRIAMKLLILCVTGVVLLSACGGTDVVAGDGRRPDLNGRTLHSTAVTEGGESRPLVEGTRISITFGTDDGPFLSVTAGCNSMSSGYEWVGLERIKISEEVAFTSVGCDDARHAQDDFVLGLLRRGPRITSAVDGLRMTVADVEIEFVEDVGARDDGDDSANPAWDDRTYVAVSVTENGADRTIVDGTRIELTLREEALSAHAGCNEMGAVFAISGDGRLVTSGMSITEIGCDPDRHAQDDLVMALLASEPGFVRDGGGLTLSGDDVEMRFIPLDETDVDRRLIGTTWLYDGFDDGDAVWFFSVAADATITFSGDLVHVVGPCVDVEAVTTLGDAVVDLDRISWTTTDGCDEEHVEFQRDLARVLDGRLTVAIDGPRLRLVNDAGHALNARAAD